MLRRWAASCSRDSEALGRTPEASRYSPDMSRHYALGTVEALKSENQDFSDRL